MRAAGIIEALRASRRVLCVGIGGGGDVVGALATAEFARSLGVDARLGGVTWERRPVDPLPGPRRLDEIDGAEPVHEAAALAGPDTRGPGGFLFAESGMARLLDQPVVLIDPNPGPAAVGAGLAGAARRLECDLIVLVDVGGDVLAHGDEPALGSPLCDAVMLAAARHLGDGPPAVAGVFGAGCDGELTHDEVLARVAEVAAAGGLLGVWGLTPGAVERVQEAVDVIPTEASAQALACARGGWGEAEIRDGRRRVPLSPLGALTFYLDADATIDSAARLAGAVAGCPDLEAANSRLNALGVGTELDWERSTPP